MLDAGADPADPAAAEAAALALDAADLLRADLRAPEADAAASLVAAHPGVRAALVAFQRAFGRGRGAVMDGRDIGTAIFPDAAVKLFVTASAEARAERRWLERASSGMALAEVLAEMRRRDARDAGREVAPLRPAADAVVLDTTALDADDAFEMALGIVRGRLGFP